MLYWAVFVKNVRLQMMFRSNFLLSIAGSLLFVYVQVAIWQTLLMHRPDVSPVGIYAMITHIIISYALREASRTAFARAFDSKVNKGSIALDLIHPINPKNMMIAEQVSNNVRSILFTVIPMAVVSWFVWGFEVAANPAQLGLFAASAIFAVMLAFYIEYIFGMLVFWTRDYVYTSQLLSGLRSVFAGAVVPLWFYPEWLRTIGYFLPFRFMVFEPIQIFLATVSIEESVHILVWQAGWLVVLWVIERFIWSKIKNNIFVQGG